MFSVFEAPNGLGGTKKWAIGQDSRGIHTFYTEPSGSKLIYFHKPLITDFNGLNTAASEYMIKKVQEKGRKGYADIGRFNFLSNIRTFY